MYKVFYKRCICFVLSIIMMLGIVFTDGAVLCAFAEEIKQQVYTYDNFNVEYQIESEWSGAQSVKIKVTNTGENSILNWHLKYNAGGNIENLYNAVIHSNLEEECILKHNGYNYEIEPNSTIEFGYILQGENLTFPDKFELCNKRVEKESGYTVDFNITSEWDKGFNADIVITNTTDEPIEAWTLAFDSNFEINNYWNCQLLDSTNNRYTIANKLWTTPILAGGTAKFGFSANIVEGGKASAENWILTEVVCDIAEEKDEVKFSLIAFAEYIADANSLMLSWLTEFENGTYEILSSDDGNDFETIASVSDVYSYEYKITDSFEKRYFKIKQTLASGGVGESNILLVCKGEDGYAMEFADTDNDGVADYLETGLGLDVDKIDTDDDGLTDYEEIFLTGTDPTVYDSIKKGVADSESDSDGDGLSNKKEIELGTSAVTEDTDKDGLSDGDEIDNYKTNPLKDDTDDDGILDSDEIAMGLDPLNPSTYGVPDSEYTFSVALSEDSEAMSEINVDNAYNLSIEIKAAGNVGKNIDVHESNYSETIKSSAVVGKSFDIEYDTSCKTEEITIKFKLDESISDTFEDSTDIEKYCVFKLFENYNVILPMYTEYDTANNMISAQVDELGTYCLMDMEKLVENVTNSNSEQEETQEEAIEVFSLENQPVVYANSRSVSWQNLIDKSSINVVFVLDIRDNIDRETFDSVKSNVINAAAEIFEESPNAKIYLILQHYDKTSRDNLGYTLIEDEEKVYFTNLVRIRDELDYRNTYSTNNFNKYCILSDAVKYVFDNCDNSNGTYCFSIFDSNDVVYRTSLVEDEIAGVTESDDYGYEVLNRLEENQIDVSIVSNIAPEYNLGYAIDLYESTGGIYIDGLDNFSNEVLKHIYGYIPNHCTEEKVFFNGLNFQKMELGTAVTKEYQTLAEELGTKMQEALNSEDKSGIPEMRNYYSAYADKDEDYVYDFEEIDVFSPFIDWDEDGNVILFTIEDYCDIINNKYVTKAKNEYINNCWNPLLTMNVMPIISDPMNSDTDMDGFVDYYEMMYNKNKKIASYAADEIDNSLYYLDPICKTKWEAKSDLAHYVEIAGYEYNQAQHIIYSKSTPIQRFFGFARTVDLAADPILSSAIFCDPIYFFYDGKEYLLELWKGQYGIMSGTEVGLYYRKPCSVIIDRNISQIIKNIKYFALLLMEEDMVDIVGVIDEFPKKELKEVIYKFLDENDDVKEFFENLEYDFNADDIIKICKKEISVEKFIANVIEGGKQLQKSMTYYDDSEEKWYRSAEIDDTIKISYTVKTNKLDENGDEMKDINGVEYNEEHPSDEIEYEINTEHWWATGFEWGKYTDKEAFIEMEIKIDFHDAKMADAFVNGGEFPHELYEEKGYNKLYDLQKIGLENAIEKSEMNDKSSITLEYSGGSDVTMIYKNYCITNEGTTDTKQVQSSENKEVVQDSNWVFIQGYKQSKADAGIPFEFKDDGTEHVLYTNDPNLMTVKNFFDGMIKSGCILSTENRERVKQSIETGLLGINGKELSVAINLIDGMLSEAYGFEHQFGTYIPLINTIFKYAEAGSPVVSDFVIKLHDEVNKDLSESEFEAVIQETYENLINKASTLGTSTYYDKNGKEVYLNDLYDQWYEDYVKLYGIDMGKESKISDYYYVSTYNYSVNHLMGMILSFEFIIKQVEQLQPAN